MKKLKKLIFKAATLMCLFAIGLGTVNTFAQTVVSTPSYNNQPRNNLRIAPSVIANLQTKTSYNALLKNSQKPEIVFCEINGESNLILDNKDSDITLKDFYTETLKDKIIPAVVVETIESADALKAFLNDIYLYDLLVVSSNPLLIKEVRSAYGFVRGVLSAIDTDISTNAMAYHLASEATANKAQIILFGENATRETVEAVQARSVLCWVKSGNTLSDVANAVAKGGYGIMNEDYQLITTLYSKFQKGSLSRNSYIVGHRGMPTNYNENSVEGLIGAFKSGATHVECDIRLTSDNELVVIHDNTLNRTSTGTGNVEQMSLAEIRKYKLIDNAYKAGESTIPIIEDFLDVLNESENKDKILVIEIKQNSEKLIDVLKDKFANYENLEDRIVFITFYENLLSKLESVFPAIPRGFLDIVTKDDYITRLSPYNAFIDTISAAQIYSVEYADVIKNRGYAIWAWTFADSGSLSSAVQAGFSGLTTNNTTWTNSYAKNITAPTEIIVKKNEDLSDFISEVTLTNYGGEKSSVSAQFILLEGNLKERNAKGIFKYSYVNDDELISYNIYSNVVSVKMPKNSCGNITFSTILSLSALIFSVTFFLTKKHA